MCTCSTRTSVRLGGVCHWGLRGFVASGPRATEGGAWAGTAAACFHDIGSEATCLLEEVRHNGGHREQIGGRAGTHPFVRLEPLHGYLEVCHDTSVAERVGRGRTREESRYWVRGSGGLNRFRLGVTDAGSFGIHGGGCRPRLVRAFGYVVDAKDERASIFCTAGFNRRTESEVRLFSPRQLSSG